MKKAALFFPFILVFLLAACTESHTPYPRPYGYPRIDLPEHSYETFQEPGCPFTFEYPAMGTIKATKPDSCWVDISYPEFACKWHITYRHIPSSGKSRSQHFEEYRKLIYKHSPQVTNIEEFDLATPQGSGTLFELFGKVGTPAQVFFTNEEHIMMVSWYFDTATKNDSLSPVIDWMKGDLDHAVQTLTWR